MKQYESPNPIFGQYYIEVDYKGEVTPDSKIFEAICWDLRPGGCGVIGEIWDGDCSGIYDIFDGPWKYVPERELYDVPCRTIR